MSIINEHHRHVRFGLDDNFAAAQSFAFEYPGHAHRERAIKSFSYDDDRLARSRSLRDCVHVCVYVLYLHVFVCAHCFSNTEIKLRM